MARFLTPPVTVVQGDDAPDIVVTLQQDQSESPYVLTDKAAFAVIVDKSDPKNYIHKFECQIENENLGKVRISWLKDPVELTSYLEDLQPGKRYEIQVFLGRTNLPPSYIDIQGYYSYFNGRYFFTGAWQEGSPIYKHETEELFLSRSLFSGEDFVWLVTSKEAATWDDVKDQDKSSMTESDLTQVPVWNYAQILTGDDVAEYDLFPKADHFTGDVTKLVITPEGVNLTDRAIDVVGSGRPEINTFYIENRHYDYSPGQIAWVWQESGYPGGRYFGPPAIFYNNSSHWLIQAEWEDDYYRFYSCANTNPLDDPPQTGWYTDTVPVEETAYPTGVPPAPTISAPYVYQGFKPIAYADLPTDIENRGTQTVLTHIPLIVKPAYRLGNEDR